MRPLTAERVAVLERLEGIAKHLDDVLEKAQREGIIAKPLEATVSVTTEDPILLEAAGEGIAEIEEFLILSNLTISKGPKNVVIGKTEAGKCERCWRHREEVGSHAEHSTLCGRCVEAVDNVSVG